MTATREKSCSTPKKGVLRALEIVQTLRPVLRDAANERLESVPLNYKILHAKAMAGKLTQRQAIRAQCLECVGWVRDEVSRCSSPLCSLYRFRPFQG